ncbi:unnamed protein product [Protopolystoma xenopodis]|uniref:Serine-threonine/tyrosine-protein kinase catalytic domain-containing protein n=1 Tax=Protopolystoma xenopodis TaxID=117903 RepID=A0A3S5ABU7_9PLAT|nr:unnamed protein product [Protopolystoma xenopodis]
MLFLRFISNVLYSIYFQFISLLFNYFAALLFYTSSILFFIFLSLIALFSLLCSPLLNTSTSLKAFGLDYASLQAPTSCPGLLLRLALACCRLDHLARPSANEVIASLAGSQLTARRNCAVQRNCRRLIPGSSACLTSSSCPAPFESTTISLMTSTSTAITTTSTLSPNRNPGSNSNATALYSYKSTPIFHHSHISHRHPIKHCQHQQRRHSTGFQPCLH